MAPQILELCFGTDQIRQIFKQNIDVRRDNKMNDISKRQVFEDKVCAIICELSFEPK